MDLANRILHKETFYKVMELIIVLLIGFGLFIYSSTNSFLDNIESPTEQDFNSFDFYFIVIYELIALTIIIYILKKRKWNIQNFNLDFKLNVLFIALILVILRYSLNFILYESLTFFNLFNPELIPQTEFVFSISTFSIVLMLIVNSIFEETILIGYLFKRLERLHIAIIIIFSLLIRLSFHTYQGTAEIPRVIALGLVLGLYYGLYKKLLPVILAHGIGNLLFFLNYEYNWIEM
jgi:membrane protease YdiL (CAAX protease family)